MTAPVKVGDRVRVVLEGEVLNADDKTGEFYMGDTRRGNVIFPDSPHVTSVEVIPPAWLRGDVLTYEGNARFLLDGNKGLAWYDAAGQWQSSIDAYNGTLATGRKDCRAIIRGGKVVTP